jgi:hypothetical protein
MPRRKRSRKTVAGEYLWERGGSDDGWKGWF